MREIKFRVWDANKKMMHSFGELGVLIDFGDLAGVSTRYSNSYMDGCYTDDAISAEESNDYRIMQYTGLKDKNVVEIYEGDICKNDVYGRDLLWIWEYRVDSEYVGFLPVCISDRRAGQTNTFMSWATCGIIGNIYENPELIK